MESSSSVHQCPRMCIESVQTGMGGGRKQGGIICLCICLCLYKRARVNFWHLRHRVPESAALVCL